MSEALEKLQELGRKSKFFLPQRWRKSLLIYAIAAWIPFLFVCSSLKHALFQSTTFDLGIFDQALYLIARGEPAVSSLLGFHILGDHAAFILYPLALLYKIYPAVHWLFALQAIALSLGIVLVYCLAVEAGLSRRRAFAVAIAYLLYPLIFNINLFDFHPDVFLPAGLLAAVWMARRDRLGGFVVAIALVLSCKAVFSLTVAAMGVWLLFDLKQRKYGAIALLAGGAWFFIATQIVIPTLGGETASLGRHLWRYAYLGDSFSTIFRNFLLRPQLVGSKVFSLDTFRYICLVIFPVVWGLSPRHLMPLMGAVPAFMLNILANDPLQRDLVYQYSLPILPFLFLCVISTLAAGRGWRIQPRTAILWSAIAFFAFAKHYYFIRYAMRLDTWTATREAMALIQPDARVLTDNALAPHLAHRPILQLINIPMPPAELDEFDTVLIDLRRPWPDNRDEAIALTLYFLQHSEYQLSYRRNGIYLFQRLFLEANKLLGGE
ncbi:MAG: DUF2079 domain-containing protein [Cyanobacteriota bacterium]|nr:DUF2079 domain-containing protein [Cyanobacteriota bacterium]